MLSLVILLAVFRRRTVLWRVLSRGSSLNAFSPWTPRPGFAHLAVLPLVPRQSAFIALPTPISSAAFISPVASFAAIVAGVTAALRLFLANACEFYCDFCAIYTLAVHVVDSVTGISRVVVLLGESYNEGVVCLEVQVSNSAVAFEYLL